MTELETYKKALEKISKYGIKPTSETKMQRIKRLKSIADKALFIANVMQAEPEKVCPMCDKPKEKDEHNVCEDCVGRSF